MKLISVLVLLIFFSCNDWNENQEAADTTTTDKISEPPPLIKEDTVYDIRIMIKIASEIMNILKIPIRNSIHLDGKVEVSVDTSIKEPYTAYSFVLADDLVEGNKEVDRYYKNYKIMVSPFADSIYHNKFKKPPTSGEEYRFLSIKENLIHETAHYLQKNTSKPEKFKNTKQYISEPREKQAWAVGCYYFLNAGGPPNALKEIMNSKVTMERKWELIINKCREQTFPTAPKVFK